MMIRSGFCRLNQLVVKNKTKNPVPDYVKKALERNNPDRGIKFTLSNYMNDQMLLGKNCCLLLILYGPNSQGL